MTEITLTATDIHCDHCKSSIESAVSGVAGVASVEVTIEDRTIGVRFNDPATPAVIVAAIESQGYVVD